MDWAFDVETATHDDLRAGVLARVRSRVLVSRIVYPTRPLARDTACALAVAVHGGMATRATLVAMLPSGSRAIGRTT